MGYLQRSIGPSLRRTLAATGLAGTACLVIGCPDDDAPSGSGTGGDEDMPEGIEPGPGGPGCAERIVAPPGVSTDDLTAASQPVMVERVVALHGDRTLVAQPAASQVGPPASLPLAAQPRGAGATTGAPHIHERWRESRKLELSYCINGMPGEDAENQAAYHKTIRALSSTMAEWERATGANFVHVAEDDTPATDAYVIPAGDDLIARADCAAGTKAYFGVVSLNIGQKEGVANTMPQAWNDPALEPVAGNLARILLLNRNLIEGFGDDTLLSVLRHELGHMMGFAHEEVNHPGSMGNDCSDLDPRPLTPVDPLSVMTTPGCTGLSDAAEHLTHHDRLSAFFLHHTPRSRFETRVSPTGYRYGGFFGGGAEILWHSEGATEGTLWRPQLGAGGFTFLEEPFPYASPEAIPAGGWYPNESEVVIPLKLDARNAFALLFHGPGPDVDDLVVFNSAGSTTAIEWSHDELAVPVVGRFDGSELGRDAVYLYQPGTESSTVLLAADDEVSIVTEVAQQPAFAYPLAAPYRGTSYPDDVVWLEPHAARVTTWRLGSGIMELAETARRRQSDLGLVPGEHVPAIGDFDGDGRADIMWQGVSNLPAGHQDIEDVLWLSRSTPTELAFALVPKTVGFGYRPLVGDFDGDGIDDIVWQRSWGLTSAGPVEWSTEPSFLWYFDGMGGHEAQPFSVGGDYSPYVGDFDADGCHDIAWLDAVGDELHVWRCLPGMRDFDCGATMSTPPDAVPVGMHWGF